MDHPYEKCIEALEKAIEAMRDEKPLDHSEYDRAFAVTITELEKALAYFLVFVVQAKKDLPF